MNAFLGLLILVAIIYSFAKPEKTEVVSVDELSTNYRKYAGKKVGVRGIVKTISIYSITIIGHEGRAYCTFKDAGIFSEVGPGDEVTVTGGTCTGANASYNGTFDVSLKGCTKIYVNS